MSYRTEKTYLHWIRRFIRYHNRRHPREMGGREVEDFLTALAVKNQISASTQNQALAAILFLYRDVLDIKLPWLANVIRAKRPQRLPVVLTRAEVQQVLTRLSGTEWLIVSMLYGSGMRLGECMQLRIKDLELSRREVFVRDAKGQKDRITILPEALLPHLQAHLAQVRLQFEKDRSEKQPGISVPFVLRRKYPNAATSWAWYWVFPSPSFCLDTYSQELVRHHLEDDHDLHARAQLRWARRAKPARRRICLTRITRRWRPRSDRARRNHSANRAQARRVRAP